MRLKHKLLISVCSCIFCVCYCSRCVNKIIHDNANSWFRGFHGKCALLDSEFSQQLDQLGMFLEIYEITWTFAFFFGSRFSPHSKTAKFPIQILYQNASPNLLYTKHRHKKIHHGFKLTDYSTTFFPSVLLFSRENHLNSLRECV